MFNWDAVCILLDVGTKPTGTSIYELWKCKHLSSFIHISLTDRN
jgi:cellulose synthase/poly-beta-1,6-N-acetylglucosamine synthase-like glycosyltransferase